MKRPKFTNPLDALSEECFRKLKRLEECPNLDFLRAVKILGLDPGEDFRHANLSGISFDGMDLREFDLTGADTQGCSFQGTRLPEDFFVSSGRSRSTNQFSGSHFTSVAVSQDLNLVIARDDVGNFLTFSKSNMEFVSRRPLPGSGYDIGFIPKTRNFFSVNSFVGVAVLGSRARPITVTPCLAYLSCAVRTRACRSCATRPEFGRPSD